MTIKFICTTVFAINCVSMMYAQCDVNINWKSVSQLRSQDKPVIGGYDVDNSEIFVCRALHEKHQLVGKGRIHNNNYFCYVSYGFREHKKATFEFLINPPDGYYTWKSIEGPNKPATAIIGGIEESPGQTGGPAPLYIGQCELTAYLVKFRKGNLTYTRLVAGHFDELKTRIHEFNIVSNSSYRTIISGKVNLISEEVSVPFNGEEYLCKRTQWPTRLLTCELTTDPKGLPLNESISTTLGPDKLDTGDKDQLSYWVIVFGVLLFAIVGTCIGFCIHKRFIAAVPSGHAADKIERELSDYHNDIYEDGYYSEYKNGKEGNVYDEATTMATDGTLPMGKNENFNE